LAAAIEEELEIPATIVEGHNAIYEVKVDDEVIYTNHNKPGVFANREKVIEEIRTRIT
jgi:hypothetical protein